MRLLIESSLRRTLFHRAAGNLVFRFLVAGKENKPITFCDIRKALHFIVPGSLTELTKLLTRLVSLG